MNRKEWYGTLIEILKWALVIWLLWPVQSSVLLTKLDFLRVVLGVGLFIIFTGKLFYDVLIKNIMMQKRKSLKQDLFSMLGTIAVMALVIGAFLVAGTFVILRTAQKMNPDPNGGGSGSGFSVEEAFQR